MTSPQTVAAQDLAHRFVTLIMADDRDTAATELAAIGALNDIEMMRVALQLADLVVLVNWHWAQVTHQEPQAAWQNLMATLAACRMGATG